MASIAVQARRGTTAEHAGFTGLVGEVTVDTDKDVVVVHDGATAGGHPLAKESALASLVPTSRTITAGIGLSGGGDLSANRTLAKAPTVAALSSGASVASDWANIADGGTFTLTALQSFVLANPSNLANGKKVTYRIKQGPGGGRTITLDTQFRLGSDISSVVLSTAADKVDYLVCYYDAADAKIDVVALVKGY
jgi:hypothetical protein